MRPFVMRYSRVTISEAGIHTCLHFRYCFIPFMGDVLMFEASPKTPDSYVVRRPVTTVHADS